MSATNQQQPITRGALVRLYPNRAQAAALRRWQGGLRFVWNHTWAWCQTQRALEDGAGKWPNKAAIQAHMVGLKRLPETAWITDLPAHAVLALAEDLHRAMRNWFEKRSGAPKFRGKHQRQFSVYAVNQSTTYSDSAVKLPKLGPVRFRAGDLPPGRLVFSRIYREAGKWYMSSSFECAATPEVRSPSVERVGVDMGVKTLATIFDGKVVAKVENPKALLAHEVKLRRYQRRLSRRKAGSHRREIAKLAVSRLHQRIANIRKDAAHKATSEIIRVADTIVVENLNVRGMLKNRKLAKSVADASMSEFLRMLRYKAQWSGRTLVEADRWFPSTKTCSVCGTLHAIGLGTRWLSCACGNEMDRDENAARNLFAYREEPGNVGVTPKTRGECGDQARGATSATVPHAEPRILKRAGRDIVADLK